MDVFDKEENKAYFRKKLEALVATHISEERVALISAQISNLISSFFTKIQESGIVNFDCSSGALHKPNVY